MLHADHAHLQEHVNIGNEIDKEIMRAHDKGTPKAIYDVVDNFGEEFGQTNTCTSLKYLGEMVQKKPELKDEVLAAKEFKTLLGKLF